MSKYAMNTKHWMSGTMNSQHTLNLSCSIKTLTLFCIKSGSSSCSFLNTLVFFHCPFFSPSPGFLVWYSSLERYFSCSSFHSSSVISLCSSSFCSSSFSSPSLHPHMENVKLLYRSTQFHLGRTRGVGGESACANFNFQKLPGYQLGLKIIFIRRLVMLTRQTHLSSNRSRFWPVNMKNKLCIIYVLMSNDKPKNINLVLFVNKTMEFH